MTILAMMRRLHPVATGDQARQIARQLVLDTLMDHLEIENYDRCDFIHLIDANEITSPILLSALSFIAMKRSDWRDFLTQDTISKFWKSQQVTIMLDESQKIDGVFSADFLDFLVSFFILSYGDKQ